jgi:hypothetical protein
LSGLLLPGAILRRCFHRNDSTPMPGEKTRVIRLGCRITHAGERTIASRQHPSGRTPLSLGMLCLGEGHAEHSHVLKQSAHLLAANSYTRQCSYMVSTLRFAILGALLDCCDICVGQDLQEDTMNRRYRSAISFVIHLEGRKKSCVKKLACIQAVWYSVTG